VAEVIAQHSSRAVDQVLEDIDRDRFMNPAEAIEYGLIDAVLEPNARPEAVDDRR
jgi:ATP-dependent Clp protease protease subunit